MAAAEVLRSYRFRAKTACTLPWYDVPINHTLTNSQLENPLATSQHPIQRATTIMARPVIVGNQLSLQVPIFFRTFVFLYFSHNVYQVYKGVHPVVSPRLAAAGVYHGSIAEAAMAESNKHNSKKEESGAQGAEQGGLNWIDGLPLPSLDLLMRPFRKE